MCRWMIILKWNSINNNYNPTNFFLPSSTKPDKIGYDLILLLDLPEFIDRQLIKLYLKGFPVILCRDKYQIILGCYSTYSKINF